MQQQQDLTAPVDRVKVSRRELFQRSYEMYQDEQETPQDLTGYTFKADLANSRGHLLTLAENTGITRPVAHAVAVTLNTIQMGELVPGEHKLMLYGIRAGERENFVQLIMQVEP